MSGKEGGEAMSEKEGGEATSGKEGGVMTSGKEGKKSLLVETVIFIPFTPKSELKRRLQEVDNVLTAILARPKSKFIEKAGVTSVTDVGRPNPWAAEVWCSRKDCLVCQGRSIVASEKEEEAMKKITGEGTGMPNQIKK